MPIFKVGNFVLVEEKEGVHELGIITDTQSDLLEIHFDDGESRMVRKMHCTKYDIKKSKNKLYRPCKKAWDETGHLGI
jgi:hypothetical protein